MQLSNGKENFLLSQHRSPAGKQRGGGGGGVEKPKQLLPATSNSLQDSKLQEWQACSLEERILK